MTIGIEAINTYAGQACLDIRQLFQARGLDLERFDNLMMTRKSVSLPCEDPVTFAVNATKPIVDLLTEDDRNRIGLVITATESGLDFGKSLSTYIHDYLGLARHCRLFEVKQACYAGTAALQMASAYVATQASSGVKALVISTDVARAAAKHTYAEPSQGVGAVAMLIGADAQILALDMGASGCYSYEVMDTCRPQPEIETGDPDLSLFSYLDCLDNCYRAYAEKVEHVDFQQTFDYLVFHTPFGGMVKGAHRKLMRDLIGAKPAEIEHDFQQRLLPSLAYCVEVGNIYSATLYLALCSLIDQAPLDGESRVGLFSYGSGCSSEFYSGVISPKSKQRLDTMKIEEALRQRYPLSMQEYDQILDLNMQWLFGLKDKDVQIQDYADIYKQQFEGRGLLVLSKISNYHREYVWS